MKKINRYLVTIAIFVATFMTAVEGTIVSTAMPTIVGSLHGMSVMNWVFSIYLLTAAMMTPIYGKLADRMGRKPVFICGAILFIIGSSLCGLSQTMLQLIIFRGIQGIGAGAIMPVALTILADIYPFEKRAKILGFNNAAWGISSIVGPLCGGIIVDLFSWHWIFLINLPIGLVLIALVSVFLVEEKKEKIKEPLDIKGSLLLMIFLLMLLYGFQLIGEGKLISWLFLFVIGVALISFIWFLKTEKSAPDPVISLALFRNKLFVIVNVVAALTSGFLIGIEVYIPMWMQGVLGLPAAMGGLVLSPMSLTWIAGSFLAGRWLVKWTTKRILQFGLVTIGIGGLILALAPAQTPVSLFFFLSTILGIGLGVTVTTTTVMTQRVVSDEMIGVATSFNTLVRTIGQTVMVSVFGVVLNSYMNREIQSSNPHHVTADMLNELVNPHTASQLPKELLEPLRSILYDGLHHVYFFGVGLIFFALLLNQLQKNSVNIE